MDIPKSDHRCCTVATCPTLQKQTYSALDQPVDQPTTVRAVYPSQFLRTLRVGSSSQSNKSHNYAISKTLNQKPQSKSDRPEHASNEDTRYSPDNFRVTQFRYSCSEHQISTTIRSPYRVAAECLSGRALDQSNMGCKRFFKGV